MKRLVLLSCLFMVSSSIDWKLDDQWKDYKLRFGKVYHGRSDEAFRREIWEDNRKTVILHNAFVAMGLQTSTIQMNQFSDMTEKEVRLHPPRYMTRKKIRVR